MLRTDFFLKLILGSITWINVFKIWSKEMWVGRIKINKTQKFQFHTKQSGKIATVTKNSFSECFNNTGFMSL